MGALLVCAGLSACADLLLDQGRDEMVVRVGDERVGAPAAGHAAVLLDYALLADQTYADSLYERPLRRSYDIGDDTYCDERFSPAGKCRDTQGLTALARRRLDGWRLVHADKDARHFPCPAERPDCTGTVPGLGVQVWMRKGRVCPEAVIAFRGTDGQSADDWLSNLRWFLRLVPLYDQYRQVQDYAPAFLRIVERQPCYRRGLTRITALGHSLGGGLAQQAAYRDGAIRVVYAFDPSVVTGYYDLPEPVRDANSKGLRIERVYEHGEILAYPRWALRQVMPYPTCDPLIRTVRLHTITGNPIARHNLASMATGLLGWTRDEERAGRRADAPLPLGRPAACTPPA